MEDLRQVGAVAGCMKGLQNVQKDSCRVASKFFQHPTQHLILSPASLVALVLVRVDLTWCSYRMIDAALPCSEECTHYTDICRKGY